MSFRAPEQFRMNLPKTHRLYSDLRDGANGAFTIPNANGAPMTVIASDGMGWEHVSVSFPNRTPRWDEMCLVKGLFWDEEDCVVQYHPPASVYRNCHPFCLHLWRPVGIDLPMPLPIMVAPTDATLPTASMKRKERP